jgi:hypothetical protein
MKLDWHSRATRSEIAAIEAIDKELGRLRLQRRVMMNRIKPRTIHWLKRHKETSHGPADRASGDEKQR